MVSPTMWWWWRLLDRGGSGGLLFRVTKCPFRMDCNEIERFHVNSPVNGTSDSFSKFKPLDQRVCYPLCYLIHRGAFGPIEARCTIEDTR